MKKCEVELMKRRCSSKAGAAEENQEFRYALRKFRKDCENFARIAKISQGLRKFHNHSENFAILAKFSLCENFAKLAKFRYLSENYCA